MHWPAALVSHTLGRSCGASAPPRPLCGMERRSTRGILEISLLLATFASISAARFVRIHPEQVLLLPSSPRNASPMLHGLADVAPAVGNATASALAKAQHILRRYSDTLRLLSIPVGLVVTFLGYSLVAPVLFVAGFLFGGGISFIAVKAAVGTHTPAEAWIAIAAMIVGGTVVAILSLQLMSVGMFAMGGILGGDTRVCVDAVCSRPRVSIES